jgi:hypothetical protein
MHCHDIYLYEVGAQMPIYKKVNKSFFKKWSYDMAYVLGFFAADGYITNNKRGASFWSIEITDKDLLYSIRQVIDSDHAISTRLRGEPNKNIYRLQVGSKEMVSDLATLGFSSLKTKVLSVPEIPKKYLATFVRGYFDGDGNVWSGLTHKDRKTQTQIITTTFTSCSKRFLVSLESKLSEAGDIRGVIREKKENVHILTYSVRGSLFLYDFMYNRVTSQEEGELYLSRKKKIFEKYIHIRGRSSTVERCPVTAEVVGSTPIGRAK